MSIATEPRTFFRIETARHFYARRAAIVATLAASHAAAIWAALNLIG